MWFNPLVGVLLQVFVKFIPVVSQEANCTDIGAIFDQYSQTCFLLAGSSCGATNLLECIPNSICKQNLYAPGLSSCTCAKNLRPNAANFCYLKHDVLCSTKNDLCDPLRYLNCNPVTRSCACDSDSFYEADACVRKAGASCELGNGKQLCGAHSECQSIDGGANYYCTCTDHFTPNREHQCKIPFDKPCIGPFCDPPLVCGEKRCECPPGSKYDRFTDKCFLLFNQTCSDRGLQCYSGSTCSWRKKCTCEASLIPNFDGLCVLSYEDDCEDRNDLCDTRAGLTCRNSRCECPYGKNWVDVEQKCLTVPGGLCFSTSECVPFAECVETAGKWNCQCVDNRVPNDFGFCFVPKDQNCTTTTECDPEQLLSCLNGSCDCVSGEQAFIEFEGCRSLEDSICKEGFPPCVPNAECTDGRCTCTDGHESDLCLRSPGSTCFTSEECALGLSCLFGRCKCNLGYQLNPNIGCLPGYKTKCFTGNFLCSESLICRDGYCDCDAGQVYSPAGEEQCRSLVGSRCNNNTLLCVDGATCEFESSLRPGSEGRCECEESFESNFETMCVPSSAKELAVDIIYYIFIMGISFYSFC